MKRLRLTDLPVLGLALLGVLCVVAAVLTTREAARLQGLTRQTQMRAEVGPAGPPAQAASVADRAELERLRAQARALGDRIRELERKLSPARPSDR